MCKPLFPMSSNKTMGAKEDCTRFCKLSFRIVKHWGPSIVVYTVATTVVGLYFTDWKVTNTMIPFYGRKFDDDGNL